MGPARLIVFTSILMSGSLWNAYADPIRSLTGCDPVSLIQQAQAVEVLPANLPPEVISFLRDRLLPITGAHAFRMTPTSFRGCDFSDGCLTLPDAGAHRKTLRFEWSHDPAIRSPRVTNSARVKTMVIPEGFDWNGASRGGQDLLQTFLIGSPLHPLNAGDAGPERRATFGEMPRVLRDAQIETARVTEALMERHVSPPGLMVIAPPGTGKTEGLLAALRTQLSPNRPPRIHFVIAETRYLVNQLAGNVSKLHEQGFHFIHDVWQSNVRPTFPTIQSLLRRLRNDRTPIVVITTRGSFTSRLRIHGLQEDQQYEDLEITRASESEVFETIPALLPLTPESQALISELAPNTGLLVFDEAQHAGAPTTRTALAHLQQAAGSHAFPLGLSATPLSDWPSLMQLYGGRAFWGYLNQAASFLEHPTETVASADLSRIIQQTELAVQAGETTPYRRVSIFTPDQFPNGLFESRASAPGRRNRTRIRQANEDLYVRSVQHIILRSKLAFSTFGTTDEAARMADAYRRVLPPEFAEHVVLLHSHLTPEQQDAARREIESGRARVIVACFMLDEGIDYPRIDASIITARDARAVRIIQRWGRAARMSEDKEGAEIAVVLDLNETSAPETLELIEALNAGRFGEIEQDPAPQSPDDPNQSAIRPLSPREVEERLRAILRGEAPSANASNATPAAPRRELVEEIVVRETPNISGALLTRWNAMKDSLEFRMDLDRRIDAFPSPVRRQIFRSYQVSRNRLVAGGALAANEIYRWMAIHHRLPDENPRDAQETLLAQAWHYYRESTYFRVEMGRRIRYDSNRPLADQIGRLVAPFRANAGFLDAHRVADATYEWIRQNGDLSTDLRVEFAQLTRRRLTQMAAIRGRRQNPVLDRLIYLLSIETNQAALDEVRRVLQPYLPTTNVLIPPPRTSRQFAHDAVAAAMETSDINDFVQFLITNEVNISRDLDRYVFLYPDLRRRLAIFGDRNQFQIELFRQLQAITDEIRQARLMSFFINWTLIPPRNPEESAADDIIEWTIRFDSIPGTPIDPVYASRQDVVEQDRILADRLRSNLSHPTFRRRIASRIERYISRRPGSNPLNPALNALQRLAGSGR